MIARVSVTSKGCAFLSPMVIETLLPAGPRS
jgi:hypothetical protein